MSAHSFRGGNFPRGCSMPADVAVSDDGLTLEFGRRRVPLTPSEGFALAEQLIRKSTRQMMLEEALDSMDWPLRRGLNALRIITPGDTGPAIQNSHCRLGRGSDSSRSPRGPNGV